MTVRHRTSLPASYFDEKYAREPDPWRFATSDYERNKYGATLAALPRTRYRRVLEVGCSIGVLTGRLADRADAILAIDVADAALRKAERHCADNTNVRFKQMRVPEQWPDGRFDLIILSEVLYYLDRPDLVALAAHVSSSVEADGHVLLVHWLGETDYPLTGDEAAELFMASTAAQFREVQKLARRFAYRLDVLQANAKT